MKHSEYLATVETIHKDGQCRGIFFQTCDDTPLRGRTVALHGTELVSFSSCSYLGLEQHPSIVQAVCDAAQRYGSQFSSSRGYLSAPLYDELEAKLSRICGGYALVTSTTSLGHQSTLLSLVGENDAIVMDHQVHHSVQLAAQLTRITGTTIKVIRHGEFSRGYELIAQLAKEHDTVWFAADGVFSMYGDLVAVEVLQGFLDLAPNVRLYVDDAHGMSWTGQYGRGSFLSRMPLNERMVVAVSLNKAFAAGGGCIVFPSLEERERVRMCGGPQLFSGPLQPPILGAALASADIHLSEELVGYQRELAERVRFCNNWIVENGLPLLVRNEAPIVFIPLGTPKVPCTVAQRMMQDGFYVNVSTYPTVPMKRSGIRLALTTLHTLEQIEGALESMARHIDAVMGEEGLSAATIDEAFRNAIPEEARHSANDSTVARETSQEAERRAEDAPQQGAAKAEDADASAVRRFGPEKTAPPSNGVASGVANGATPEELTVSHYTSIHEVGRKMWNRLLGSRGMCSWEAMAAWEKVFSDAAAPEERWAFHYLVVRTAKGKPVAATFFTQTLIKDDMTMSDEVSQRVELQRKEDPHYLTSQSMMMGCLGSEGNHLYLDREGPWKQALRMILETISIEFEQSPATSLMLRDLPSDDPEMDQFLLDHGFVKAPMLTSHVLELRWPNEEAWLADLSRKKRYYVMRQMRDPARLFVRATYGGVARSEHRLSAAEHEHLYRLYRNVASQKLRLNVFPLPASMLPVLEESPVWDIVTFTLPEEHGGPAHGRPVAFYAAHVFEGHCMPLVCGLDYDYVLQHGAYRQLLYQMKLRAEELSCSAIHYGMDADFVKSRLGTTMTTPSFYVQSTDDFHGVVLAQINAEVGVNYP